MTTPAVRQHDVDGAAALTLTAGPYQATFLPGLGLLGSDLRHDGEPILALPDDLADYRAGHTTGLPLLHPWANRLAHLWYAVGDVHVDIDPIPPVHLLDGLPIHGTLAGQPAWQVELALADSSRALAQARIDVGALPDVLASFPFPHELAVFLELSADGLRVTTTLTATGDRAVPVSFGWHPYLTVPGARRDQLAVVLPERRHLALDGRGLPTGAATDEPAEVLFLGNRRDLNARTFDDLYRLTGTDRVLAVQGAGRRVSVTFDEGYPYAQVYAPAGQTFVCLEPMTAPVNALVDGGYELVAPGASSTATFTIAVAALDDEAEPDPARPEGARP